MPSNVLQNKMNEIKQKLSGDIEWEREPLTGWRELAEEKQHFYCSTLGDRAWEKYHQDEECYLKLKIGYSLYGATTFEDYGLNNYFNDPVKVKVIDKLLSIIKNECQPDNLCIAFIFVIALVNEQYAEFPIVRILKKSDKGIYSSYFLDAIGRLYKSWSNFLEDNVFPKCIYCYPKNGFYSWDENGKVCLEFGRSPRSKITKRLLHGLDTVSTVAGLGGATVGAVALANPAISGAIVVAATVAGVSSGVWTVGRTVSSMVDKTQHNQSISPLDAEGRGCWLSLASGLLGAASAGAVQYTQFIARSGRVLTRASAVIIDGIEIGYISVAGLGIVSDIATIIQNKEFKIRNASELLFSALFFCNCAMSFKTAKEVVIDIQKRLINKAGSDLTREQKKVLNSILEETKKSGEMQGNANTIKTLRKIDSKESFFNHLLKIKKKADKTGSTLSFSEKGLIRINDKIDVKPSDFNCLSKKSKNLLMSTSKSFKNNSKNFNTFLKDLKSISKKEMINFSNVSSELCNHLNVNSLNEFQINGKKILASAKPGDIFILSKTVDIINEHQSKIISLESIIQEIKMLATRISCKDILDFYSLLKIVLDKYDEGERIFCVLKSLYTEIRSSFNEVNPGFTVPLYKNEEDEYVIVEKNGLEFEDF